MLLSVISCNVHPAASTSLATPTYIRTSPAAEEKATSSVYTPTNTPVPFPLSYSEKIANCEIVLSENDLDFIQTGFVSISLDASEHLYLYSPSQQRIFIFSDKGTYLRDITLPSVWNDPSGFLPLIDVPISKGDLWFSIAGNPDSANFGKTIGTMNLATGELGTFQLPEQVDFFQRRRFFLDEAGIYVITDKTLENHPKNIYVDYDGEVIYTGNAGMGAVFYKNGLLVELHTDRSSAISELVFFQIDKEKGDFIETNRVSVELHVMAIAGMDKSGMIFIQYPDHLLRISKDGKTKEFLRFPPSQYMFEKTTVVKDLLISPHGTIFALLEQSDTDSTKMRMLKCYISKNNE